MKKYKEKESLFIINFISLVVAIFLLINVFNKFILDYETLAASLITNKVYSIVLKDKYVKHLEKNPFVYVDSKRVKIEIIDCQKNYYKDYDNLLIKLDFKKDKRIEKISIYKGRKTFMKLFFECWEEENETD